MLGQGRPKANRVPPTSRAEAAEDERELVKVLVARMYRRGHTISEIASAATSKFRKNFTYQSVRLIVLALRDGMVAVRPERTYAAMVEEKVEELREVRKEAWTAWEDSKGDSIRVVEEEVKPSDRDRSRPRTANDNGKANDKTPVLPPTVKDELVRVRRVVMTEGRIPENGFLTTVVKTLESEMKLLGLDAKAEAESAASKSGEPHWTAYLVGTPLRPLGDGTATPTGETIDDGGTIPLGPPAEVVPTYLPGDGSDGDE